MSTKDKVQDPEIAIESALGRAEDFFMRNGKLLLTILAVIVVVVGGYFGYKYLYMAPRAEKAGAAMFTAQQHFAVDSFALALNGDESNAGFLQVIEQYGGTPQGNVARHYAGICYLRMGEYENALKYLAQYKAVDGVPGEIINAQNLGLQGDANAQLGNLEQAISFYTKAADKYNNNLTAPYYLKKAGLLYEKSGQAAKALELYERIKYDYAASMEARDIDKYIGRAGQQI